MSIFFLRTVFDKNLAINRRHTLPATLGIALVGAIAALGSNARGDYTFTSISYPGAASTSVTGVSGTEVFGNYTIGSVTHGFIYNSNGGSYTTLDDPSATTATYLGRQSGNTLVGFYENATGAHGFTYTNGVFGSIDVPGASESWVDGISGSYISGSFENGSGTHGFIYDGTTFTTIDDPDSFSGDTGVHGISGSTVVGTIYNATGHHAFSYDNGSYSPLWDYPGAITGTTEAWGIDGTTIVGAYNNTASWPNLGSGSQGYIKQGNTYTTLDYPGATGTRLKDISGTTIIGDYIDSGGVFRSFIAVATPEPASLFLLGIGAAAMMMCRRARNL